jgi:hypothetical protein
MAAFPRIPSAGNAFADIQRRDEAKFPSAQSITRPAKIA